MLVFSCVASSISSPPWTSGARDDAGREVCYCRAIEEAQSPEAGEEGVNPWAERGRGAPGWAQPRGDQEARGTRVERKEDSAWGARRRGGIGRALASSDTARQLGPGLA